MTGQNKPTQKSPNQQEKDKKLMNWIILGVIIFLLISWIVSCSIERHAQKKGEELMEFATEFEETMNAITEIEDELKQEQINTLVEEGMMHVNFSTKARFDGKKSTHFNIKNIENNHDSIVFEIFDEKGESLYKSKKIAPGYEMNSIELNRKLPEGRHECTIEIQYAVEGQVSTVFPIILEVE
ncbi:MAG: hypothetical protein Q4B26_13000 [Eubacteriales bacterium]|nr:hypothetical protein [Eubacteriales bacterium]